MLFAKFIPAIAIKNSIKLFIAAIQQVFQKSETRAHEFSGGLPAGFSAVSSS